MRGRVCRGRDLLLKRVIRISFGPAFVAGLAVCIAGFLVSRGMGWGLPSARRNRLYFTSGTPAARAPSMSLEELARSWQDYPDNLPGSERPGSHARSAFNPIRSYHPDEYVVLKCLFSMRHGRQPMFPGFFGWPAFYFYCVGAALQIGSWAGFIHVVPKLAHYYANPADLARMYLVGRAVTLGFGLGTVVVFFLAMRRLYDGTTAALGALLLAVTPLFTVNARCMTGDVPMLFWVSVTLYCAARMTGDGRTRWYVLAGCAVGLAAATRYQGVLAAFLVVAAHFVRPDGAGSDKGRGRVRLAARRLVQGRLWLAAGMSGLCFLALNPYIPLRWDQFVHELSGEVSSSGGRFVRVFALTSQFPVSALGLLTAALAVVGMAVTATTKRRPDALVMAGFGPGLVILLLQRPVMVRYLMPVLFLPVITWVRFLALVVRGSEVEAPARSGLLEASRPDVWHPNAGGVTRRSLKAFLQSRGPLAVLAIGVGLLSWTDSLRDSLAYANLCRQPNVRTVAGEYIASRIKRGTRIGVLSEPWQFEMPPIDPERYHVEVIGMDPTRLMGRRPDFFICSELQKPPLAVRGPLNEEERDFWEFLDKKGLYALKARQVAWPRRGGLASIFIPPPHDMRYVNPVIDLYKRVSARDARGAGGSSGATKIRGAE